MKYYDLLPDNNIEKEYFKNITKCLSSYDFQTNIISINYGDDHLLDKISGDKIVIMNADEKYRTPECVNDPSVKMVFKQYAHEGSHAKVRPIPLGWKSGYNPGFKPLNERKFTISFSGQLGNDERRLTIAKILELMNHYKGFVGISSNFNQGLDVKEYANLMTETQIAICPTGAATNETFRFFEAMMAGCIVVAPRMPDNWFYRDAPYIIIEDHNWITPELIQFAQKMVDTKSHRLRVLDYFVKYFCPKAVAEYIINEVKQ